jgi:ABC-type transport system involved in multi-copper enzyme maturation permease subunit
VNGNPKAPTPVQVVTAIARREIVMAMRRRLVKLLFLGNLIPPLVMAAVLLVAMIARGFGLEDLGWDPLVRLLQVQTGPVLLLALGIGTPLVARDRSEDVLFLYATRPVTPWSYTVGKMLAVAVPAVALLVIPSILIAILRAGMMESFGVTDSLALVGKIVVAALLVAWGYSGVTVGPSAATKKARWALLLAFACFTVPEAASEIIWRSSDVWALGPGQGVEHVIAALFEELGTARGLVGAACLVGWGTLGAVVTAARVRREMIP